MYIYIQYIHMYVYMYIQYMYAPKQVDVCNDETSHSKILHKNYQKKKQNRKPTIYLPNSLIVNISFCLYPADV